MDLTINADVKLLAAKSDMDAVSERMASFNIGWTGAVTFEQGTDGPVWRLKIYRDNYPNILADLGCVLVTDASFISWYPSADAWNAANPDNQLPGGS